MNADRTWWSDTAEAAIRGDLTAAVAYPTPAGGAVVVSASPVGLGDREAGRLGFTTSLGFPRKVERILRAPRVSLAYHTRDHGFATNDSYVLVQGRATVDLEPSPDRSAELMEAGERFMGKAPQGPIWDWWLREYHRRRVFVDIDVERVTEWPDLAAQGARETRGAAWPAPTGGQEPPRKGTGPRVDVESLTRRLDGLSHRLLAYEGVDGFPVIVPVEITGHDETGLHLDAPTDLLPTGGRRAGLLAHTFRPRLVGLGMRTLTGWLTNGDEGVVYAPHTSKGMAAPPVKTVQMFANGLLAKHGVWRANRDGTERRLRSLAGRD